MPNLEYPGFTGLSDQVLFRAASTTEPADKTKQQPRTVIIYGWGDGQAKHVAKYTDGFQQLFPSANQIMVLSPISRAMWQSREQRAENMTHVVKAAFPNEDVGTHDEGSVLIHMLSNTGAIFYTSTLHAYREAYNRPLPHRLVVLDSTPGTTEISLRTLPRLSHAMTLGTAAWFPWPFLVTQCLWATFLAANHLVERITGRDSAPLTALKTFQNPDMEDKSAKRLYLYSKDDQIILWSDIEEHIAESREQGWQADGVIYEGSGHVRHMQVHPEKYWKNIQIAWIEAMAPKLEA
jgi:predicted transposase YbfD/YdcC